MTEKVPSPKPKKKKPFVKKLKFFLTCLLILTLLFVFRNFVVKQAVSLGAWIVIGAPVTIDDLEIDLLEQEVAIEGLKVYNPKGFPKGPFIELNTARIEYNPWPLLKGELHFDLLYIDIHAITLVDNEAGETNVDSLALVKRIEADKKKKKKNKFNPFSFHIDLLRLNIEQLAQITHRKNNEPFIKVYEYPARNKVFRNITSPEQLVVLIILEAVGKATIKTIALQAAGAYLGVNTLPVSVAGIMLKKDNTAGDWPITTDQARQACLDVIERIGQLYADQEDDNILKAKIYGAHVTIRITEEEEDLTRIRVYARKFALSRKELAAGILYQIAEHIETGGFLKEEGSILPALKKIGEKIGEKIEAESKETKEEGDGLLH